MDRFNGITDPSMRRDSITIGNARAASPRALISPLRLSPRVPAADAAYVTLKSLHVLAASALTGGLLAMLLLRSGAEEEKGRRARGISWTLLASLAAWMNAALAMLLVTGLLMIFGPAASKSWTLVEDWWTSAGLAILVALGGLLGALVSGTGARLARHYGADKEPTQDTIRAERRWRAAAIACLALAALATTLMVAKPEL